MVQGIRNVEFSLNLHLLLILMRWLNWALQDFSDFLLVDGLACIVKFELVLWTSHSENFEAIDLWDELGCRRKSFIKVLQSWIWLNSVVQFQQILTLRNMCGKLAPKYAPSISSCFYRGRYTSWQRGQYTLTREVDNSSETPIGKTCCLSQSTRGHVPKAPYMNFSLILARPCGERMNLAWMTPYKSIADW